MIHVHALRGCAPVPLAHYLKALGILRLVAEQADPGTRGVWRDDCWVLTTKLDDNSLTGFFMTSYRPTPLVAPWNGGTGFYPGDKKARRALDGIMNEPGNRLSAYRDAITLARTAVGSRTEAPAPGKDKGAFLATCFKSWRGPLREAIAAAVVLNDDCEPSFPSLLGTGFNDGRLDFTSNFAGRLLQLLDPQNVEKSAQLLRDALWQRPVCGMDRGGAIGQFLPGGAGGANCTTASRGDAFTNPWDFILMLEGAVLFSAAATRRLGARSPVQAGAPFSVRAHAAGSGSISVADESARGEQWMPLWERPMSLGEVRELLAEGRAQIGARAATRPLDLARAVAQLGVARGLTSFERYGYLERNGQANLAVPLGRVSVSARPRARLIDDLDEWLNRLHRAARAKGAPARLQSVERQLADAVFAALTHDDNPARWQAVLTALTTVESAQAMGSGITAGPIPRLLPDWIAAADDGTAEFRLALALASAAADYKRDGHAIDPVRHHYVPLEPNARRFATQGNGLARDVRVVATGRDPVADLLAIVQRRLIESERQGGRRLALCAARGTAAHPTDLAALLAGHIDLHRCGALARALMALDWRAWCREGHGARLPADESHVPDDAWMALRLALLPWPLDRERDVPADPAIARRLAAGDATGALDIALRRLRAKGVPAAITVGTTDPAGARLWGAALAFPIHHDTAQWFARRVLPIVTGV